MWAWLLLLSCVSSLQGGNGLIPLQRGIARRVPAVTRSASAVDLGDTPRGWRRELGVVWRFTRPHTFIGTALSVPAVHALAAPSLASMATPRFASSIGVALVPALLVNVFITGVNQLSDVEIDKINKPQLVVASGELSFGRGCAICGVSLALALALGALPGSTPALRAVLWGSAALGAAYSAPPIRLKRWPLLAMVCIVVVRGALVNACFYAHACALAFEPGVHAARSAATARLPAVVSFFALFGVAIALMKDVPDVEGDGAFAVPTLSTRFGQRGVFALAARLEAATLGAAAVAFLTAAAQALLAPTALLSLAATRGAAGGVLLALSADAARAATEVDAESRSEVTTFYMRLWKIFYACYAILPLVR